MQLALVHDWLNQLGGAERVLEDFRRFFPDAPIYTSIFWRDRMPLDYQAWDIRTTWMDRLPSVYRRYQWYFPLYALVFARLNLADSGYDVVLSNKSGFCHGVQTGSAPHLCYCLAPTRYVWEYEVYAARENLPLAVRLMLKPVVAVLRRWDYGVAQRSTVRFVAISSEIRERIRRYYHRDSEIIFPPVDVDKYSVSAEVDDYYLIVSRLVPYKRIDLAVRAFTELGLPLRIAGSGRDRDTLEAMAGPNVEFLGYVPDAELPSLMARCKAFVFPGREDFGIAPLEAQASGRPVIAFGAGGALDSVLEGVTGVFFREQTVPSLIDAVRTLESQPVDSRDCRANAERFSVDRFRDEIMAALHSLVAG